VTVKALLIVESFLFAASGAFAQPAQAENGGRFEVAAIKRSNVTAGSWIRFLEGGRFSATSWVKQLIQVAYNVEDYQVIGGPSWLSSDRYEIEAKAENASAGKNEMLLLLRSLLADRFKLQIRQELRQFPVYELIVDGNAPKLRPLKEGEPSRCTRDNSVVCGISTTTELARFLKGSVGKPVVDKTGASGRFDILLDFDTYSARGEAVPPDYHKPALTTALREQLGLRLLPQKASFPVLVVASVERPTEN
jgi:uncharacterized protein (TIGR03435 family)